MVTRATDRSDGYLAMDISATGDGLLFINDAFYRERKALVTASPWRRSEPTSGSRLSRFRKASIKSSLRLSRGHS